jgi:hypothetical protein
MKIKTSLIYDYPYYFSADWACGYIYGTQRTWHVQ